MPPLLCTVIIEIVLYILDKAFAQASEVGACVYLWKEGHLQMLFSLCVKFCIAIIHSHFLDLERLLCCAQPSSSALMVLLWTNEESLWSKEIFLSFKLFCKVAKMHFLETQMLEINNFKNFKKVEPYWEKDQLWCNIHDAVFKKVQIFKSSRSLRREGGS